MKTSPPSSRLSSLEGEVFDTLVIGGGITGSGIARDLATRGLKTILFEKDDFAAGTSSKSGKLIHGGLRYLSHGHFKLVYESCRERFNLMNYVASHLIKPIPFLMTFNAQSKYPRWFVALGLALYEILALFRNVKLFRFVSTKKLKDLEPSLVKPNLKGCLLYYDCMSLDFRLTIDTIKSAKEFGAKLFNYCEIEKIHLSQTTINKVEVRDKITNHSFQIHAKTIINASGAWGDEIIFRAGQDEKFHLKITKGIHLIFRNNLNLRHALAFSSLKDRRDIYVVPWQNYCLLGTTDTFYEKDKDHIDITSEDIDYLLESFNQLIPSAKLDRSKIISAYAGIRPLIGSDKNKKESQLPRDYSIKLNPMGLISITGGKLTTYRDMAKNVVDKTLKNFFPNHNFKSCQTLSPISGGQKLIEYKWQDHIPQEIRQHLTSYYGSNFVIILQYADNQSTKLQTITNTSPHIWAEIDYAIHHEFTLHLLDLMQRRLTFYWFSEDNGLGVCEKIATYMGDLLGWQTKQIEQEIAAYQSAVENMHFLLRGHGNEHNHICRQPESPSRKGSKEMVTAFTDN